MTKFLCYLFFLATQQLRRAKRQANKNKPDKIEKKNDSPSQPPPNPSFLTKICQIEQLTFKLVM